MNEWQDCDFFDLVDSKIVSVSLERGFINIHTDTGFVYCIFEGENEIGIARMADEGQVFK